jgi:hypothetical protein
LAAFPLIVADDFVPERYQDSFLYAKNTINEEISEEIANSPVLIQNAYYGANNGVVGDSVLGVVLSEPPKEISVSASFEVLPEGISCQCIDFIKEFYAGLQNKQLYNSGYVWRFHDEFSLEITKAQVGALILFKNHIAVIEKDFGDTILIVEKNHIPCKVGRRILDKNDERIIGFLK